MPRNTDVRANVTIDLLGASMRPRRDAAEYIYDLLHLHASAAASMRPRRDAAEYLERFGSLSPALEASMRPRRDAAEYLVCVYM